MNLIVCEITEEKKKPAKPIRKRCNVRWMQAIRATKKKNKSAQVLFIFGASANDRSRRAHIKLYLLRFVYTNSKRLFGTVKVYIDGLVGFFFLLLHNM